MISEILADSQNDKNNENTPANFDSDKSANHSAFDSMHTGSIYPLPSSMRNDMVTRGTVSSKINNSNIFNNDNTNQYERSSGNSDGVPTIFPQLFNLRMQ